MPTLPLRTPSGRRGTARAGVVGLAVLTSAVLGAGPAGAAGSVTIPLDPADVTIYLDGVENHSASPIDPEDFAFTPLPAAWGGQVVLQLPDRLDGSAMDVHLDLSPDAESESTRTYSTTTPGPDGLVVSPLGSGRYGVTLPTDDGDDGPIGWLHAEGITSLDGHDVVPSPDYQLELSSDAPPVVELEPQPVAFAEQLCPVMAATRCPTSTVTAGTSFALTVPPTSVLRGLDTGTLETAEVSLLDVSGYGLSSWEPLVLSDDPALFSASGPWDATVTLPGGLRAGDHQLSVQLGDATSGGAIAIVDVELHVLPAQAPPAATPPTGGPTEIPAPQPVVLNAGLRSNTGVTTAGVEAGSGGSAPAAAGAGLLVLSGVGGVAVVRARRRPSAEVGA
jgi:hypothetical protein